jgi:uncharacterized protein YacL
VTDVSRKGVWNVNRSYWDNFLLRAAFVVLIGTISAWLRPFDLSTLPAILLGIAVGAVANVLELRIRRARLPTLIAACAGVFIGGLLGLLFVAFLSTAALPHQRTIEFLRLTGPLLCGFLGLLLGVAKADLIDLSSFGLFAKSQNASSTLKLLDTSVLIDGRIADVAESGFIDGRVVIPQFVLHELQLVADSADSVKRNRGRRGLDIVQRLQKIPRIQIEVSAQDFPTIREVDLKLIEFAKFSRAKIVTNDFNLNKLAQVQGIDVLNINELANALKPIVLPGETMRVFILKEGKEYNQGVAYLDDGTMVVVDNARRLISKTVDITVTSVLQTTAGKMIFGKYDERQQAAVAGTSSS